MNMAKEVEMVANEALQKFIGEYYYADAPGEVISNDAYELTKLMREYGFEFTRVPAKAEAS